VWMLDGRGEKGQAYGFSLSENLCKDVNLFWRTHIIRFTYPKAFVGLQNVGNSKEPV
jgi:hypothetical protein